MVDMFRVKKPISSLSFSPLGDFLATTHANSRAISLWYVSLSCVCVCVSLRSVSVSVRLCDRVLYVFLSCSSCRTAS